MTLDSRWKALVDGLIECARVPADPEIERARQQAAGHLAFQCWELAIEIDDSDLARLASLVWALKSGRIASQFGRQLPARPGKASAFAVSTILTQGWTIDEEGRAIPPKRRRPLHTLATPDEAGRTWFKRFRRNFESVEFESGGGITHLKQLLLDDFLAHKDRPD